MVDGIDWSSTRAYTWSDYGNVQLNVRGRQALGAVGPDGEYEAARNELRAALLELRHPDNDGPVVTQVYRAEELYEGPHLDMAPDLLVETRNYEYEIITHLTPGGPVPTEIDAEVFPPALRGGTHRAEGMLIASGPDIRAGAHLGAAHLEDMTPTILNLLGLPIPSYMDGHVLEDLCAPAAHVPAYAEEELPDVIGDSPYSDEEAAEVEQHLRDLGYV
jgi:predicted AlkP superfamily phosphohydrolase/phosphomutase